MFSSLNFTGRQKLPSILQAENSECGITCIAMIAAFFGDKLDLAKYRNDMGSSQRGSDIAQLMRAVKTRDFNCRAIRCEVAELKSFTQPVILHWNFNHFVVLNKVSGKNITIHDPALGSRRISLSAAAAHFTGVVLEIIPGPDYQPETSTTKLGFRDFIVGLKGLIPTMAQILLLAFILQIITLLSPFYTQLVIDDVLVKRDADLLIILALGFGLLSVISVFTQAIRSWASIYLTHQLSFQMGSSLFRHLIHLPVAFFHKRHMGDIVSRFGSLTAIQEFITSSAIAVILDGLMAITTLIVVFIYSPMLASLVLLTIVIDLIVQLLFYQPVKSRANEQLIAEAKMESHFMETIRAISAVKRFGTEGQRTNDWLNKFTETINTNIRTDKLELGQSIISGLIAGLSGILVIYFGALQVLENKMSIGMLFAFIAYKTQLQSALGSLVGEFIGYLMLSLQFERLADIKSQQADFKLTPTRPLNGAIELNSISFRYDENSPWLLKNLNLSIKPGQQIAVFGPSGCGKSTLFNLIQVSQKPLHGEITYDHQSLATIGLQSIQSNFTSVMQEDLLLAGSIRSNITFGEPVVDWQQLEAAAKLAEIHDEITLLPMAYETLVGELGACLSAGQIQRILIARALYRQPRVIFLDEGTAHLDEKTAEKIMDNIRHLGITCLFITHDPKLLNHVDAVLWMDNGEHRLENMHNHPSLTV
ncbi:MAG: peptidase domain-containing ABC transporter [Pseudomonadales bacterium]|nr:peptidase domain-containing ABC transporter [Pseudomonadales bacterium]